MLKGSKYRLTLRCAACGTKYRKTVTVPDGVSINEIPDPPCPTCAKVAKVIKRNWGDGRAPSIGGSVASKAIDETARIVMEDHKMTDLKDSIRPGEAMAPKVPAHLQRQVDSFWGGPRRGQPTAGINTAAIAKSAMAGSFRTPDSLNPVAMTHQQKVKPPIHIINTERKA